nr:pre-mRNA splicing Prp18-interacting factor [Tanacetum cinerariifolium]
MSTFVLCVGCGTPLYGFSPCQWCTCERCGNDLRDGFYSLCNSRNSCVYDPNPNSFDCPPDSYHPPHPTYETYSCDSYGNDSHFGYDYQPQFPLNYESEPGYTENYNSYPYDSSSFPQQELCCEDCRVLPEADHCQTPQYTVNHLIFKAHNDFLDYQNKITIAQNKIMEQMTSSTSMCEMACQIIQTKQEEKQIKEEQVANARYWKIPACCDDDDDYDSTITPNKPVDSLSMGDEHLDTIHEKESDEFIKSSVENLVPNPYEFEDECECDVPDCDDSQTINFSTFSNPLFDDSTSSDDESSHEEVIYEMSFKTYSNPLFDLDEEIISSEFNPIHNEDLDSTLKNDRFDTKSYPLELLLNRDTLMISSLKIDSLLAEFVGELIFLESIPSGIAEANCDPVEDIHLVERLLYDNSSPRPLKEFVSANSNAKIKSFSPSPIPVEDSDSRMEEIDLYFNPDDPMPRSIEEDDDESERG